MMHMPLVERLVLMRHVPLVETIAAFVNYIVFAYIVRADAGFLPSTCYNRLRLLITS